MSCQKRMAAVCLSLALNAIHTQIFGECRLFVKTTWGFSYAQMTQLWRLTALSSVKSASLHHTFFSKLLSLSWIHLAKFILAVLSVSVISWSSHFVWMHSPRANNSCNTSLWNASVSWNSWSASMTMNGPWLQLCQRICNDLFAAWQLWRSARWNDALY